MIVQDNGGRRPPKENNRNANGFGSTDIREKAKNGDKVNIHLDRVSSKDRTVRSRSSNFRIKTKTQCDEGFRLKFSSKTRRQNSDSK